MRLLLLLLPFAVLLLLSFSPVWAQPGPAFPTPIPPDIGEVGAMLAEADEKVNQAFNLLGLFEAIGLPVTVFLALVGLVGPAIAAYFVRIVQRANTEVQEAKSELKATSQAIENTRQNIEAQLQDTKKTSSLLEEQLKTASADFKTTSELRTQEMQSALLRLETFIQDAQSELDNLRRELGVSADAERERTARALMGQTLQSLGERQYRERDFKGAIETLNRALELDDYNPITHYQLGYVYVQSSQLEKAEEHLVQALKIDPRLAQALATLGYVYRRMAERMPMGHDRMEKFNVAESKLLEALRISPRLIDNDGESWWGSLGGSYRRQGQIDQAIHAYEEAAKVTPRSSYPFSNLAMIYLHQGNRDAMLSNFANVEKLALSETQTDPHNYWAFADLVTSRLAQKKTELTDIALDSLLFTVPYDSMYVLESLADTLQRLMNGLGGEAAAPHIAPYIRGIRDHIEKFEANQPVL